MAATYTLSVIVPIYGVEKYIAQFAHTLLGQTYPQRTYRQSILPFMAQYTHYRQKQRRIT